jgi:hypothetical protein
MGDLREIVDVGAVEHLFVLLAVIGPIVGALSGAAVGAKRQNVQRGLLRGLLIGLFGPLNWLLWRVYNALTDRNGLDTVWNLIINLALFLVVGALIGLGIGWALRRQEAQTPAEKPEPDSS